MITISGINCEERVHQYSEEASLLGGFQSRKGFICDWSDRLTVARGLLGLSTAVNIGGAITIHEPAAHPEVSGSYCLAISIEGIGKPTQGTKQLQFEKACVWANYGVTPWSFGALDTNIQIDPNTPFLFATQELSSSCEWLTLPGIGLKWKYSDLPLNQPAGVRTTIVNMTITLHQMAYMPTVESVLWAGLSNAREYLGVKPGHLLYDGIQTQTAFNSDGSRVQQPTYKFQARSYPWDHMYDPDTQKFDQVLVGDPTVAGGWRPIVPRADFNWIIPMSYSMNRYPIDPRPVWPPDFS